MPKRIKELLVDLETGEIIDTSRYVELDPGDIVLSKNNKNF